MHLRRLALHQFCQYEQETLDFTPGVNLVVGRNGSGKSNAMKGAYAAVTNDFGRNPGVKLENVRHGAPDKAPAYIELVLGHGDTTLEIIRGLRRKKDSVRVLDSHGRAIRAAEGSDPVSDTVLAILGVSPKLLSDYVFVDQWSIFSFLSMLPAERAKALQRLFGTDQAATIYQATTQHLSKLEIPSAGLSEEVLKTQLKEAQEELALVERQMESCQGPDYDPDYDATKDKASLAIIAAVEERARLFSDKAKYESALYSAEQQRPALQMAIDEPMNSLTIMQQYLDEHEAAVITARTALVQWDTYQQVLHSRQHILIQIEISRKALAKCITPPIPDGYIHDGAERAAVETAYNEDSAAYERASRFLRAMTKPGLVQCPECGTPVDTLRDRIEAYKALQTEKRAAAAAALVRLTNTSNHNRVVREQMRFQRQEYEHIARRELEIQDLPNIAAPLASREELQEQVRLYEEMAKTVRLTTESQHAAIINMAKLNEYVFTMQGELFFVEEKIKNNKGMGGDVAVATRHIMAMKTANTKTIRELQTRRRLAQEARKRAQTALEGLGGVRIEADALRAWTGHARALQEVVHYKALPQIVAQTQLELLEDEINDLLRRFDSEFTVTTGDDLSFVAQFWKGHKVGTKLPAGRLSGGEKVVLAIAFRVAVNSIFAKDIGLLVLDEPTAGLDDGNLACLGVAFQRLGELSRSRGLQVVLITHERNLPAADNLITIGAQDEFGSGAEPEVVAMA